MRKHLTRRLLASSAAAMLAAGLMAVPSAGAATGITPDSQTLVYLASGFGEGTVLCANPDDDNLWIGKEEERDASCQWEQIGDDTQFSLFNPSKGMVLTGLGAGRPLAMREPVFPTPDAQTFSWGSSAGGGRALRWNGDLTQNVDAGSDKAPSDDPITLGSWRNQVEQTWAVVKAGTDAKPAKARSAGAVRVTSSKWPNQFLCPDPAEGTVNLSNKTDDSSCEWLPFGQENGPFVLYNPEYGKAITYNGGVDGPLWMVDLKYPGDKSQLWSFSSEQALQWVGDTLQRVDAGATRPTPREVRTRMWDKRDPEPFIWMFAALKRPLTATVSLGDSFMSGEGGRWKGNSNNEFPGHAGTDLAYKGWGQVDERMVYGSSFDNRCNRSRFAEVHSSDTNDVQINLACSGARTKNIYLEPYKGEEPQAAQLAKVAVQYDVRLIALSIGGNDLGFKEVITNCVMAFLKNNPECAEEQQKIVSGRMEETRKNVVAAIRAIRKAMTDAGYKDPGHYRIVLQSAPSPLPAGRDIRFKEDSDRTLIGGCPFWNNDADWAKDVLTPQISRMLESAADIAGVGFLDLKDSFNGREVCSRYSRLVNPDFPPSGEHSEWARFLVTPFGQGQLQEVFHPSYFGQLALGRCLALYDETALTKAACTNKLGVGPAQAMVLTPLVS